MRQLRQVTSQRNWYPSNLPRKLLLFNNSTESPFTGIWQVGWMQHLPLRISSWTIMWAFGLHESEDQRGRFYFKELQEAAAACWRLELLSIRPQRLAPSTSALVQTANWISMKLSSRKTQKGRWSLESYIFVSRSSSCSYRSNEGIYNSAVLQSVEADEGRSLVNGQQETLRMMPWKQ